jgi:hypothetical protein
MFAKLVCGSGGVRHKLQFSPLREVKCHLTSVEMTELGDAAWVSARLLR